MTAVSVVAAVSVVGIVATAVTAVAGAAPAVQLTVGVASSLVIAVAVVACRRLP